MPAKNRWLACGLSVVTVAAHGHHSPAAYDLTTEIEVVGTIAEIQWTNPHIYVTVDIAEPDGRRLQRLEADGVAAVRTSGLTKDILAPGARVAFRAVPNRRGLGHTALAIDVTTADGSIYPLGPRGRSQRAAAELPPAQSLAAKWAPKPSDLAAFGQAARAWPLTDAARAAMTDVAGTLESAAGCTPYPQPALMAVHLLRTIEITNDAVLIHIDWPDVVRTVRLDLAEHPADVELTLLGHSIGWWEGETLVIDTVGFSAHRQGIGWGIPSSSRKHMVERLSLTEDRRQLRYEFALEDPEYLTAPVSYTTLWDHRPDLEPSTEPCDPDVARRFLDD